MEEEEDMKSSLACFRILSFDEPAQAEKRDSGRTQNGGLVPLHTRNNSLLQLFG